MENERKLNLKILKPTKVKPKEGDIFVLEPVKGTYYFGRIIIGAIKSKFALMNGMPLIYIYNIAKDNKDYDDIVFNKENLLLPPIITNYSPWIHGYFETVGNKPVNKDDVLKQHCFHRDLVNEYVNESGDKLWRKHEPCGKYGLASYKGIDWEISKKLNLATN